MAFDKLKINISELEEFISYVDMPKFAKDIIKFPRLRANNLGFCDDPENQELIDREEDEDKEHVDYFYPLMQKKSI